MCIKINKIGKQEVRIWWVQKRFPRYGVPIWSLWPNIRFLPSIVAEKNVTKNEHICSMCIKINKVSKREVGIWWVQKGYPRYGVPIWSLWPNIRFLPSTVAEKMRRKMSIYIFIHIEHICSFFVAFFSATIDGRNLIFGHKLHIVTYIVGSVFGPIIFLLPVCRLCWFVYTLNIHFVYAHFSSHFSQQLLMAEIWYLVTSFI